MRECFSCWKSSSSTNIRKSVRPLCSKKRAAPSRTSSSKSAKSSVLPIPICRLVTWSTMLGLGEGVDGLSEATKAMNRPTATITRIMDIGHKTSLSTPIITIAKGTPSAIMHEQPTAGSRSLFDFALIACQTYCHTKPPAPPYGRVEIDLLQRGMQCRLISPYY